MAHSNSAKKRIRQNITRRSRNRWRLVKMRSAIKDFHEALSNGTVEQAQSAYRTAAGLIDKTAQKGPIHRNQAARRKSRLNTQLKAKAAG